jgi:predicted AAA+ superfamily ATPase
MQRYCAKFILEDLAKKMVFIGGPRQVGKTTLSKSFCTGKYQNGEYFNWDVSEDRYAILKKQWDQTSPLIIFDELHKYPRWKQWIKGIYDSKPSGQQYVVTGSARLDTYRRGGDSLMGRYHYWRLHPITLDEEVPRLSSQEVYDRLLTVGGFPEPFFTHDEREARRWRRERFDRVLREDIQDLEPVRQTQLLQLFIDALRKRVGGIITLSHLAQDLEISPKTAKNWLTLIEKMYIAFPVYPFTHKLPRAIQKPPKVFFYDNADVEGDVGARVENLVATHLLKRLHFIEDYHGYRCELRYIRDKEGREVDFITLIDNKVIDLIEVKTHATEISSSLKYYKEKLKPQSTVQLVSNLKRSFDKDGIRVVNPIEYFKNPPWK